MLGSYGECICGDLLCVHQKLLLNSITIEIIQEIEQLYYYVQEGYLEIMNQLTDVTQPLWT